MKLVWMLAPLALSVLGACATAPPAIAPSLLPHPSETGPEACFFRRLVVSFEALDNSNLIVFAPPPDDVFHVRIEPVPGLSDKGAIAFASRSNRVCGTAGDAVFFEDRSGAPRYRIEAISLLDRDGILALRERAGLAGTGRSPVE